MGAVCRLRFRVPAPEVALRPSQRLRELQQARRQPVQPVAAPAVAQLAQCIRP
jgi:hypothetical protein